MYFENILEIGEIAPYEQFLVFSWIFYYLLLDFYVENRDHQIFTLG